MDITASFPCDGDGEIVSHDRYVAALKLRVPARGRYSISLKIPSYGCEGGFGILIFILSGVIGWLLGVGVFISYVLLTHELKPLLPICIRITPSFCSEFTEWAMLGRCIVSR